MQNTPDEALRIDRWLWFTRFYKTRSLAAKAVAGGHVKINGERAKSGQRVRPGDRLSVRREQLDWDIEITGVPLRRGPAAEARSHYVETDASRERRDAVRAQLATDRRLQPRTAGRPDKHTRRLLRDRNRGD